MHMHACVSHVCLCPKRPEEGIKSPRAQVTGSYMLLTWVLGAEIESLGEWEA